MKINYDYTSESNFEKIFRLGNYLTPLTIALYSNSPFESGKPTGYYSYRNKVWQNTARGGIMPIAFEKAPGAIRSTNPPKSSLYATLHPLKLR